MAGPRGRTLVLAAVIAVVPGCTAAPGSTDLDLVSTPAPTVSATPAPTPTPSPATTMPPLATVATTERDGVAIRLELERNPLPAGHRTWATVTIRNTTSRKVSWMSDGCGLPAMVLGTIGGPWVGGAPQSGIAAQFKAFALEPLGHAGQAYLLIGFTAERHLGNDVGCADTGISHVLEPGAEMVHRAAWDGALDDLVPPDGPVNVSASFPRLIGSDIDAIEVGLPSWIVGGQPFEFLTPAAAIDAALADPEFSVWLERAAPATWINSSHTLDPDAGTWQIGLFRDGGAGLFGGVTMDARTGAVLGHRFE